MDSPDDHESKNEQIKKILEEDLLSLEDICACMLARKGLEGVVIVPASNESELKGIWGALEKTMDAFLNVIGQYPAEGLGKACFQLENYEILFYILPGTDSAVVAIASESADRGPLEIAMENARKKIIDLLGL